MDIGEFPGENYAAEFFLKLLVTGRTYLATKEDVLKGILIEMLPRAFVQMHQVLEEYQAGNNSTLVPFTVSFLDLLFPENGTNGLIALLESQGEWIPGLPSPPDLRRQWRQKYFQLLVQDQQKWRTLPIKGYLATYLAVIIGGNFTAGLIAPILLTHEEDHTLVPPYHIEGDNYSHDIKQTILDAIKIVKYHFVARHKIPRKTIKEALHGAILQWRTSLLSQFSGIDGKSLSFPLAILFWAAALRQLVKSELITVRGQARGKALSEWEIVIPDGCIMSGAFVNDLPDSVYWEQPDYEYQPVKNL